MPCIRLGTISRYSVTSYTMSFAYPLQQDYSEPIFHTTFLERASQKQMLIQFFLHNLGSFYEQAHVSVSAALCKRISDRLQLTVLDGVKRWGGQAVKHCIAGGRILLLTQPPGPAWWQLQLCFLCARLPKPWGGSLSGSRWRGCSSAAGLPAASGRGGWFLSQERGNSLQRLAEPSSSNALTHSPCLSLPAVSVLSFLLAEWRSIWNANAEFMFRHQCQWRTTVQADKS